MIDKDITYCIKLSEMYPKWDDLVFIFTEHTYSEKYIVKMYESKYGVKIYNLFGKWYWVVGGMGCSEPLHTYTEAYEEAKKTYNEVFLPSLDKGI